MSIFSGLYLNYEGITSQCNATQQNREIVFDSLSGLLRYKDIGGAIHYVAAPTPVSGTNIGTGSGVYKDVSGNVLRFKSFIPGSGITIIDNGSSLTLSSLGGSGTIGPVGPSGAIGQSGVSGNTILNGTNDEPSIPPYLGKDGDFYLNTYDHFLFGPKVSGVWTGGGISLIGPAGAPGASGLAGPPGPTGPSGSGSAASGLWNSSLTRMMIADSNTNVYFYNSGTYVNPLMNIGLDGTTTYNFIESAMIPTVNMYTPLKLADPNMGWTANQQTAFVVAPNVYAEIFTISGGNPGGGLCIRSMQGMPSTYPVRWDQFWSVGEVYDSMLRDSGSSWGGMYNMEFAQYSAGPTRSSISSSGLLITVNNAHNGYPYNNWVYKLYGDGTITNTGDIYGDQWQSYTPGVSGFSSSVMNFKYKTVGKLVFVKVSLSGVGNGGYTAFSVPYPASDNVVTMYGTGTGSDGVNGINFVQIPSGTTRACLESYALENPPSSAQGSVFSNGFSKWICGQFWYERV